MHDAQEALFDAALARWPEYSWHEAAVHHGAFHIVLIAPDGPSLRATLGHGGRQRSEREAGTLRALQTAGLPLAVPTVLGGPYPSGAGSPWLTLLSTAPGSPTDDLTSCSAQRLSVYAETLAALRATETEESSALPPVRSWCGCTMWPDLVQNELVPLFGAAVGQVAMKRITELLEIERQTERTLCHGDFGPHNILWDSEDLASLIDLDHACIGDPALDLAPLISFHGASRISSLGSDEEISRAMIHRATLPLQVAVGAHLAGLAPLRDHALANFARRISEGTLFDPDGATPG